MTHKGSVLLCTGLLLSGVGLRAQEPRIQERTERFVFEQKLARDKAAAEGQAFEFVTSELLIDGKSVKNAPYSADAVNETTQVLADGNRIVRKNTTALYRDSEGRTRREQTLDSVGPLAAAGEPRQTVFINDPVAGVSYVLNPKERTARKIEMPRMGAAGKEPRARMGVAVAESGGVMTHDVVVTQGPGGPDTFDMMVTAKRTSGNAATESLGTQMIEGVRAEGKRITWTIPAGSVGNERPIQIVSEQWYSPELQALVLSKRSDPRSGDTVYRLSNVRRSEPPRNLFEVPSDYTVSEAASGLRMMEKMHTNER